MNCQLMHSPIWVAPDNKNLWQSLWINQSHVSVAESQRENSKEKAKVMAKSAEKDLQVLTVLRLGTLQSRYSKSRS